MKELRGRNAVLTGGSRGIGPCIGRALAAEGVNIALAARSAVELSATARELSELGIRAVAIPTDVTDPLARRRLVQRAEAELGPIDILINDAGILEITDFARQTEEAIARIVAVNLVAPLLLTRLFLPRMLARRQGHIVTIAAIAKGIPYEAAYSATKVGLVEWNNALRIELEGTGVSVSAVCPGYVSGAGGFSRLGARVPRLAGASPASEVAKAVVRAIRYDAQEILVWPGPARLLLTLNTISPALGNRIMRMMGITPLQRELAGNRDRISPAVAPLSVELDRVASADMLQGRFE
jgi:short-subunit dehydrogenase